MLAICTQRCCAWCPGTPSATLASSLLCACRCALPCPCCALPQDLIKYSLPHDVWFHVDALSSAHVYLRLPEGARCAPLPRPAPTRPAPTLPPHMRVFRC